MARRRNSEARNKHTTNIEEEDTGGENLRLEAEQQKQYDKKSVKLK